MAVEKLTFEMNAIGNAVPRMKEVQQQLGKVDAQIKTATNGLNRYANSNRALSKTQGNLTRNLGMASLQFQDIAVQASMGTSALRIMTMQGPQLASVFGPKGMIIGALVAVGGALAMLGDKTSKMTFDFKKFGADMKTAFAPVIQALQPVINAVSVAFDFLKRTAMEAINGILNGFIAVSIFVTKLPPIFIDAFNRISMKLSLTAKRLKNVFNEAVLASLKLTVASRGALGLDTSKTEQTISSLKGEIDDTTLSIKQLKTELDKPFESVADLSNALKNMTTVDIFSYFKRVAKEADDTTKNVAKSTTTVADMIGNKFGDAFMSLLDGTRSAKDAFRAMAIDIIRELQRIFIVKKITGFISASISQAFPAFGNMPARAMGGPVSANKPFLVGERGPELMVPNRSGTVVPNSKLGSSVVVNQTINVTTGVQQTVRAEVLGLLPQISEASKAAVLDAKRRGGAFAGAF